ncbi:unnamed protein product [Penicillium roqueforti FM164]|jgi:hypothetical protein|uniref:Genomic scaffold, ProqFM164S02 n=1 Tax=Penicillium roqueforti (strain FM164) TaxID=1365484 RepID=W6QEJ4_PENRF|nr:unnamed protein product [Penicillium roqueforti FM164]
MHPEEAIEAPLSGPGIYGESGLQPRTKPLKGVESVGSQEIEERRVQIYNEFTSFNLTPLWLR